MLKKDLDTADIVRDGLISPPIKSRSGTSPLRRLHQQRSQTRITLFAEALGRQVRPTIAIPFSDPQ